MKKILAFFFLISLSFSLSSIDFDPDLAHRRFFKGINFGGALFPTYEGRNLLLEFDVYGVFEFDALGFGFGLPIRFLLKNEDDIPTTASIFPKEDWDDARDWVSILTYFRYGCPDDLFYFYFGEQKNRYIGNGTILGGYYANLRFYYPKRGVNLEINSDYMGIDFFMDDVTPPSVIGGRFYLKPVSFFSKESYGNNLELGFSYLTDYSAPYSIEAPEIGSLSRRIKETSEQIFGFDLGFRFLAMKYYHLKFYTDVNKIVKSGLGLHFGLQHKFILPSASDMQILSKWEFRTMESDYIPVYFNTFYDIEREYYRNGDSKSKALGTWLKNRDWANGYYLDLLFDIAGTFSIGASFEHNRLSRFNGSKFDYFNNFQINIMLNASLFNCLELNFVMALQDLGEKGKRFADQPFYNAAITYVLNKYFSFGFYADSKWYLVKESNSAGYYKSQTDYAIGAFGGIRF